MTDAFKQLTAIVEKINTLLRMAKQAHDLPGLAADACIALGVIARARFPQEKES